MRDWERYIARLKKISDKAAAEMQAYVDRYGFENTTALINRAYALATKYGEASAAAACEMYDAVAEASMVSVPPAIPAETATYEEVAKAINGTLKTAQGQVPQVVGRKVKQAGADTTLKNAIRDGAEFAWVPHGDTCAFCITLASWGWRRASAKVLKGGHADHIHSNCDCEFAIRFDGKGGVRGYDPERYKKIYYGADPNGSSKDKINAIRREQYAQNKEKINAQKRAAYARRTTEYNGIPKNWHNIGVQSSDDAMKKCNPNYDPNMHASKVGTKEDYNNNCTNSVVAYEMRKRGYDVTACSAAENRKLKSNPFSAWKGRVPTKTKGTGLQEILDYLAPAEDGTRIEISIKHAQSIFAMKPDGHVFVAEKQGKKIVFLDPQRNRIIDESIFSEAVHDGTMFMRIDDLEVSDRGVTACKL